MDADPQRTSSSFDRPEWTPGEPPGRPERSWFDAPAAPPRARPEPPAPLWGAPGPTAPALRDTADQAPTTPPWAAGLPAARWGAGWQEPAAAPQGGAEQAPPAASGGAAEASSAPPWAAGPPAASWGGAGQAPPAARSGAAGPVPPAPLWGAAEPPVARWGAAEPTTAGRGGSERPTPPWGAAEPGPGADDGAVTESFARVVDEPGDRAWSAGREPVAAGATRADVPAPPAVRHPLRLALFALVLFGLVAGSVAWMSMDKSVRLTVDGEARAVSTYASTVAGVLDDAGVTVGDHDTLAPAADAKVSDGAEIVLNRGRLVTLIVDGRPRKVWVTATTVEEALKQVGFRQTGLFVSANRSERLPLEGYELTLRTPKAVTVVADGRKRRLTTTAATVGEVMDQAGVRVDGDDKVSQLATAVVRAGMTVTVTRVSTRTTTSQTVVEYKTVETADPKAEVGSRTVKTKGVTGLQQVTRVLTYVDGKLTTTRVAKITVVRAPVDEVVVVGPEPPEPPPTQPAECKDFPTTGGLNWCGLAKCESGLNPNAYNPAGPYYGLYQFDQGTWTSNGGAGSPSGKSVGEQTAIAWNLYQARGASPWPTCGRQL